MLCYTNIMIPNVTDSLKMSSYRFLLSLYGERCTLRKKRPLHTEKDAHMEKEENKADRKVSRGQCFPVTNFLCSQKYYSFTRP